MTHTHPPQPDEVDQNAIWQKALNSAFTQFESYWRVKWTKKSLDTPEQRRKALDDCLQHAVGILRLHEFTINESKLKEERELRVKDEERHEALLAQQVKRADELLRRIAALEKAKESLLHLRMCRSCGEDDWNECEGGRLAQQTLSELEGGQHA